MAVIKTIKKAPLCAAYLFDKAQRMAWRTRAETKPIWKKGYTKPGKGTSAEHMISNQPELISQVIRTLTHDTYWGAVNMVDHTSNFCYFHLIRGTTNSETLTAKDDYERVLHSYGHKVESYHGNNSKFDTTQFKDSCDKAHQT
eukprot:15222567-Ditylum_brightwellii.AAC.1